MEISLIYCGEDVWAFGVRSISAMLKKVGYQTKIIIIRDIDNGPKSAKLFENIRKEISSSELVGIGCFSPSSDNAFRVIREIRSEGKPILWGGVHATLNPKECAKVVDVICVGEGEEFVVELAGCIEKRQSWKGLLNAAYMVGDEFVCNDLRPLVQNLDELPPADFSFENEYHVTGAELTKVHQVSDPTLAIMFNGTRGCAFSCNYCTNSEMKMMYRGKGKYVRKMSPNTYIDALRNIKTKFPQSKYFNLIDEDFFAWGKEKIEEFALLYKQHIDMPLEVMGSPRNLVRDKLAPLAQIGLWRINMGVESGSERTKKEVYNRHMTNEEVIAASKLIGDYPEIVLNCFIIVGNPYETNEDLVQTVELFKRMHSPFSLVIYNLILFPGIELYRKAISDNIINGKTDSGYEMNFLGGLHHADHHWKKKNLYMNGLIYLMMGKASRLRFGIIPRALLPLLLDPKIIAFNDRYPNFIKFSIGIKKKLWRIRSFLIRIIKICIKNPTLIAKK